MHATVLCLMGPTASGKTHLSLQLAKDLNAEIISVDSAMVYRGMDIGTAKPLAHQREQMTHHLIDTCDPSQSYSAAQFQRDAHLAIHAIQAKGKTPLLVGGTMLYFKALQEGLSPLPSANEIVRKNLNEEAKQVGWIEMHKRLASIDPESASRIKPTDTQRIQRALEVYELTGQTLTTLWHIKDARLPALSYLNMGLWPEDRIVLHDRINQRFQTMLQQGFLEEVKALYDRGDLHVDLPAIRCVGYRQVWQYLDGQVSYQEMQNKAVAATRQLAKRQLTWLRHWDSICYLKSPESQPYSELLQYIISLCTNR
jgi:tRNA dimethylallyltransferase